MDDMKAMRRMENAVRAFFLSDRDPALYLEVFNALQEFPRDLKEDLWDALQDYRDVLEVCRGAPYLDAIVLAHDEDRAATAHETAVFARLSAHEGFDENHDWLKAAWEDATTRCRAARKRIRDEIKRLDAEVNRQ
jgi:hypothetical protein